MTMDWVATLLEAASAVPDPGYPLDGISLLPVLANPDLGIERDLYWRMKFRSQRAMRRGSWKYLSLDGDEFLFDLSRDQRERANRARHEPERLAIMRAGYEAWEATVPRVPADATFSIPYTKADMAQPS
jgi:arylsulfatase A-like enzyme